MLASTCPFKVDGLTGVFVGPLDLSISLGYDPRQEPVQPEVVQVRAASHLHNARVFLTNLALSRPWSMCFALVRRMGRKLRSFVGPVPVPRRL